MVILKMLIRIPPAVATREFKLPYSEPQFCLFQRNSIQSSSSQHFGAGNDVRHAARNRSDVGSVTVSHVLL